MDRLRTDTAHVWAVDLERETFEGHMLAETLSADEWMRADRFVFEKHRAHFVAARGYLRAILAKYMECKPGELAFFSCWTRKEAYLKAVGTGLTHSLKNFEVSLGRKAKLLWIKEGNIEDWTLLHLEPAEGYVGSVAIAKKDVEVKIVKHLLRDLCLNKGVH